MKKNGIAPNRVWICMVLMLVAVFSASAQERIAFKMLGKADSKAEAIPSINLVVMSENKKSLALGGLANIIREKAYGMQIGGLYNHFGMGGGLAVGGLLNTTSGSYHGIQVGGLANIVREKTYGIQIGGLYNHSGMGGGLTVGGLLNTTSGSYYGIQVGGLGNVTKDAVGVQVGGLFNVARKFYGIQIAGVMNVAQDIYGFQLAGVTNVAKDVRGLQLAGVANIAKEVKGVQFAAILNVAEESDFPIGLVNIIGNGDMGVALTYDMLGNSMVAFRSGGKYTYGILGVGYNQCLAERVVAETGYGLRLPLCRGLQVNNELKATAPINTSSANFSYLLAPSLTLWKHFNLFGGPSLNFLMADTAEATNLLPKHALWNKRPGEGARSLYIGYQVGVQYIF